MNDIDGEKAQDNPAKDQDGGNADLPSGPEGIDREIASPNVTKLANDEGKKSAIKAKNTGDKVTTGEKDIFDRIKVGERWMILFTAIVACTTVAQFVQSCNNNRATSKQTDKIIKAANIQACAADRFSTSAGQIKVGIDTAVDN